MTTTEKETATTVPVTAETTTAPEPAAPEKHGERRLRRFDPLAMVDEMQEEMARFWSQAWPFGARPIVRPLRWLAPATWIPSTDIYENDGKIVIKAELPGMKKEDITVTLEEGDLVIKGERKSESEVKESAYYRMERSYGSFYRRIPLGLDGTPDQIRASYKDGMLELQVPKPRQAQPRQAQPQTHQIPLT